MHYGTKVDIHLGEKMNVSEGLQAGGLEWILRYSFLAKNLLDYTEYDHDADNNRKHLWNSKMVVASEIPSVFLNYMVKKQNCVGGTVGQEKIAWT